MCNRFDDFFQRISRSVAGWGERACVAIVVAALPTSAVPTTAFAADVSVQASVEDSVLVATREATADKSTAAVAIVVHSKEEVLEPISQISERSPELADLAAAELEADSKSTTTAETKAFHSDGDNFGKALGGASEESSIDAQPAKFNGLQPGKSTEKDVRAAWKEPANTEVTEFGSVLTYNIDPFKSVEVELSDEVVSAINIELRGNMPPKRLAKQLSLDMLESVAVTDMEGTVLGQVYPERGVLFLFAPPSDVVAATTNVPAAAVTHVVIQPLDADAFALRAECQLHGPYEKNIKDLQTALLLDPVLAHAHWLLAEIYLATGQADRAKEAAEEACDLEPENAAYRLRRAQVCFALSRYDEATLEVRSLLDGEATPPIVKAQALHEMAKLAALGDAEISAKTIAFENMSIAVADSLATSKNIKERRAAKQLLIEAHLAVARQISGQAYGNKLESVSQWIGRASGLAEAAIADDSGSLELRLLVAKEALGSLANLKPSKDPGPWVSEAEQAAAALTEECSDDLWQRRIQWELGQAYFQAVRIEHLRLQPAAALRYGQLAIENLANGAAKRQAVYDSEQLVGELYFHIGVVYAVQKQDHKTAAQWYDKALPLLAAPRPTSELLAPQHDGEELVSMGVTYWQVGDKDHAIDLTLNGAEMVAKAVDCGILPKKSLAVPYGNLAAMYEQLGSKEDAAKYSALATSVGGLSRPVVATTNQRGSTNPRPRVAMGPNQQRMQAQATKPRPRNSDINSTPIQRTAQRPDSGRRF